jgi:hypothetical protein
VPGTHDTPCYAQQSVPPAPCTRATCTHREVPPARTVADATAHVHIGRKGRCSKNEHSLWAPISTATRTRPVACCAGRHATANGSRSVSMRSTLKGQTCRKLAVGALGQGDSVSRPARRVPPLLYPPHAHPVSRLPPLPSLCAALAVVTHNLCFQRNRPPPFNTVPRWSFRSIRREERLPVPLQGAGSRHPTPRPTPTPMPPTRPRPTRTRHG